MICKKCKNTIPDGAIYCQYCGTRQISAPRKRAAERAITVPKPRQVSSGTWFIQLRLGGESIPVTGDTPEACADAARVIKAKHFAGQKVARRSRDALTVGAAIDSFLAANSDTLSPSTLRSYKSYRENHYKAVIGSDIRAVNWQAAMNDEAKKMNAKTVANLWRLVTAAMRAAKLPPPDINLPSIAEPDTPWLSYTQILSFCGAIKGKSCELGALLALHSLRRSEILALTPDKINLEANQITVKGARVQNSKNVLVDKPTNKTKNSTRTVPIMIPRLEELLPAEGTGYLIQLSANRLTEQINTVCRQNGLPPVGLQGLRRSFASLAYHLGWSERTTMLIGGWSNIQTVHKYYIKLSQEDVLEAASGMKAFYEGRSANENAN